VRQGPSNQTLQQTAAAIQVSRSSLSLSAAAAAELGRSATQGEVMSGTRAVVDPSGEVRVTLGGADYELARQLGSARTAEAQDAKRPGRAGCPPNNLEQDIDGAAAEIAFARAIGVAPSLASGPSPEADVAGFHVRSTARPIGKLIVRPGDPEDNVYVLVVGSGREWRVIGCAVGREAMRPEFWYEENRRPGCYMLPQDRLRPLQVQSATSRAELGAATDRPRE
jgi:hypothetical protein